MKKTIILAAFAALVLAGCAKNDVYTATEGTPLTFGVYNGNAVTKAVSATTYDTIDNNVLGNSAGKGFGVFGYYTDNANYSSNTIANFMYNEQVKGDGNGTAAATAWTYAPIKYWPNEHGTNATSEGVDKLTFLCYAPWVENLAINGSTESTVKGADNAAATEGITAMTGNATTGDAKLTFKVPVSSLEQIDLLYGVLNAKSTNVDGTQEGTVGGPIENLTKEKTGGKVDIKFMHALAKVAINIKDVVDKVDPESTVDPDAGDAKQTKVVVESLKLIGSDLSTDGKLNLYTGNWSDFTSPAATEFVVTPLPESIYSGSTAPIAYPSVAGVQETGLTKTIDIMLVPATNSKITGVEIVYYVITKDEKLKAGASIVKNTITKDLATENQISLTKGTQHNLNILLGLTSVKLTAEVSPWSDGGNTAIDLPKNVE